jgi:hypothetical protein
MQLLVLQDRCACFFILRPSAELIANQILAWEVLLQIIYPGDGASTSTFHSVDLPLFSSWFFSLQMRTLFKVSGGGTK